MKRFSDTSRFEEPWYRTLPPAFKVAWEYVWAKCDNAGVWSPDFELAEFQIGQKVKWEAFLEKLGGRILVLASGKWMLRGFCEIQCGVTFSPDSRPHQAVMALLRSHEVNLTDRLSIDYQIGLNGVQSTPKDKDKDKDPDGGRSPEEGIPLKRNPRCPETPEALAVAAIFNRRANSPWVDSDIKAFGKLLPLDLEDLALIHRYYEAERKRPNNEGIHRRDLSTFLNNFLGELDRAREWARKNPRSAAAPIRATNGHAPPPEPEPAGFRDWMAVTYPRADQNASWGKIRPEVKEEFKLQ